MLKCYITNSWGPGDNVWSSNPENEYGYSSGTSMASPNVASIVINILKEDSTRTLSQIKLYLLENANPLVNVPPGHGQASGSFWNSGCQ